MRDPDREPCNPGLSFCPNLTFLRLNFSRFQPVNHILSWVLRHVFSAPRPLQTPLILSLACSSLPFDSRVYRFDVWDRILNTYSAEQLSEVRLWEIQRPRIGLDDLSGISSLSEDAQADIRRQMPEMVKRGALKFE